MSIRQISYRAALPACLAACLAEVPAADPADTTLAKTQPSLFAQGIRMQGIRMQGIRMQGMTMQGIRLSAATLGDKEWQLEISKGEVVASSAGSPALRGTSLMGMHVLADVHDVVAAPPVADVAEYRITAIQPDDVTYDPTRTGNTYLYTLEQYVLETGTWELACPADSDGRNVAIALSAVWDDSGARIESATHFTFGCTTGVIAKCYRWGYRPWLTGYGDVASAHQTCTRMARADYCGDGTPHTQEGTWINLWDILPPPGPIQSNEGKVKGMKFEAGWDAGGAVCLSRRRWRDDQNGQLARSCPDRLIPHGSQASCDTVAEAHGYIGDAMLFNESYKN